MTRLWYTCAPTCRFRCEVLSQRVGVRLERDDTGLRGTGRVTKITEENDAALDVVSVPLKSCLAAAFVLFD
jgi:hypothetical protein